MNDSTISKDTIVIDRTFDAPPDLIWRLWTEPEHFKQWYGPQGFSILIVEMDVRVGGKHLFCMQRSTPDSDMKMWLGGEYTEVAPTTRLVYTDSVTDEQGNILPPSTYGGNDNDPTTTVVSVSLEALGARTRMVLTHAGVPGGQEGASAGWEQACDKMADILRTLLRAG